MPAVFEAIYLQCPKASFFSLSSYDGRFSAKCCSVSTTPLTLVNGNVDRISSERTKIRLGLPSKGRMAPDTLELLKGNEDLVIVHDALEYGDCRLSLAIPKYGIFENINSLKELAEMRQWTPERPLRVATGFTYLAPRFLKENGLNYVTFSVADGALEAEPVMGTADAIVDLVSSGTTLKENNLKEIEGGVVLESQAVFVASRKSLTQRKGVLDITHEMLERLEAHLSAIGQFKVEEVADRILSQTSFSGLQIGGSGVLISPQTYIFDKETPRWCQLLAELGL